MRPALLAAALLLHLPPAAALQSTPQQLPLFPRLFPKPTGRNGAEELISASDKLAGSTAFRTAIDPAATLTVKRRALMDPAVAEALRLIRTGLQKPTHLRFPDAGQGDSGISAMAGMRNIGRIMAVDIYTALADGRTDRMLETLADGLKLGYLLQSNTVLGGLVGIATDSLLIRTVGRHLGQLSARDCDSLLLLVKQRMSLEEPGVATMQSEKQTAVRLLSRLFNPAASAPVSADDESDAAELTPAQRALAEAVAAQLKINPNGMRQLHEEMVMQANGFYDRFAAEFRKPAWERTLPRMPRADTLGGRLFQENIEPIFSQPLTQSLTAVQRGAAQLQLLGVHAAVRRYWWEHARWPSDLAQLNLGTMVLDPFTGKPFEYRPEGDSYRLASAGPARRDGAPGERTPVVID
jgi:hypothetical protein